MCSHSLFGFVVLFFLSKESLPELPVICPKIQTIQKSVFTLETNQTMVQFDLDRQHLFSSDQGLGVWSRPWSGGDL